MPLLRILFLNQYFPPDPAPTGVLLRELADSLESAGHAVDFVAARQDYRKGQNAGRRMVRELLALGRMLFDGLRRPRAGLVISASSPPCLLVAAAVVAAWHRARSIHWAMDLYPEIAVALGEVREGFFTRAIGALMRWGYRRTDQVVVLDADMAARLRTCGVEPKIIRPWVSAPVLKHIPAFSVKRDPVWTWIYSGNLGRAHEWKTLLEAQALIEREDPEIRLLFQGGGPSWPAARAHAHKLGLRACEWIEYAREADLPESLLRSAVLVATQRPVTQGLLWPSKLALALGLPRPLLWVGPMEGAVAKALRQIPHAGIFAPGQAREVADCLLATRKLDSGNFAAPALNPAAHREESLVEWGGLVRRLL